MQSGGGVGTNTQAGTQTLQFIDGACIRAGSVKKLLNTVFSIQILLKICYELVRLKFNSKSVY